jgi:hypothetical protein
MGRSWSWSFPSEQTKGEQNKVSGTFTQNGS